MDHSFHGRPPTRRRAALGDATLRANEDHRLRSPRSIGDKLIAHVVPTPSPKQLPHNESLVPNGTLAVQHETLPLPSPQHKRLSAVIDECRPRNTKRDSEISNASTNASTGGRRKTHIGPWQLGKTVGKGGCSRVRIVRHSGTGQFGAAKIISKSTAEKVRALSLANLCESAQYDPTLFAGGKAIPFGLEREICIMKLLDHPYIVKLFDIWENRNELYLIMEYVEGGELFGYIGEHGGIEEVEVVHIFRQIIAALWYCHRLNIFHRDLKPENILLDRDTMTIKLVDFGMAALQPLGKKLTTPCGSPHYAAPEVIKSQSYDGGKADVWSCGVILYVLLTGTPPFNYDGHDAEHENLKPLFRAITRADYVMPEGLSREAKDLIRAILVPDPKRRISIAKIWDHPFMRKYDRELGFHRTEEQIRLWIRPCAPVEWTPLTRSTIDREILRYMRTLWHSEKEEAIVQRLLSKDNQNHEKFFYAALQKYRNEQIENYMPGPHHPVDSPSKYISSAARKVSTELEKHMEEAFNRSSMGSSIRTSTTSDPRKDASGFETPPTTFSNRDSGATGAATPDQKTMYQHRPLPPVPTETPNTFLQRKLAETRAEIARRLEEGGDSTEHFNEVLDNLDRLMLPVTSVAKRTCSAPAKSPAHPAPLHVIPEEAREDRFEPFQSNYRAFTDPFAASGHGRPADDATIRLVEQSPTHIAPLAIRKKSEASRSTKSEVGPLGVLWPGPIRHTSAPSRQQAEPSTLAVRTNQVVSSNGVPEAAEKKEFTVKKKKSSWFRRTPEEKDRPHDAQPKPVSDRLQIPEAWQGLDDRIKNDPLKNSTPTPDFVKQHTKHSDGSTASEFPMRGCGTTVGKSEGGGAFKGFFGLFGKKAKEDKTKRPLELGPPDFQMNWLSRFLHIKPANRALCFHIRRGKVRQELVYLLRDWQRYGVRDVTCDRNTNIIHARVDKNNRLNLKPVAFVIELFVVLEDNKRANLCLARFTQTRGAASSFRRAVEVIEDICREKHILIEDEQKKAAMCEIVS
ncbi:serine/threonine-protein kinase gin4 [Paraconiothyrium brasiliense]|uniref:non-specific serine/threonine protein kinase n=1 Tax=Paraconiothyrium brasiliense TaxID=300254 RepID=A0ABR3RQD9_9PLEO